MLNKLPLARRPGFILLEALIALAILGVALGALLPRVSLASRISAQAPNTEAAVLAAEGLLGTVSAGLTLRQLNSDLTLFDGQTSDGRAWQLEVCCMQTPAFGVNAVLADLTLRVAETAEPKARYVELRTKRVFSEVLRP